MKWANTFCASTLWAAKAAIMERERERILTGAGGRVGTKAEEDMSWFIKVICADEPETGVEKIEWLQFT
jgi:hypothetical protein